MGPLGFCNLCLKTGNLKASAAFYGELGFEPTGEDPRGSGSRWRTGRMC